jgi:hypothetical protein
MQAIQQLLLFQALLVQIIPILNLQANENTDDDNYEVYKYGKPVLRSNMLSNTA